MNLGEELQSLKDSLHTLSKEELAERIYRAANSVMMAEVMQQAGMANVTTLTGVIRSTKKDLFGIRGETL